MVASSFAAEDRYVYSNGLNSYIETEAIPGTLPHGQNAPQKVAYGRNFSGFHDADI
jgi:homogentisate 1,2-dioxygenase